MKILPHPHSPENKFELTPLVIVMVIAGVCTVDALAYSAYGSIDDCTPKVGHVTLNGELVWRGSWCETFDNLRGVNVLLIDPFRCSVQETRSFDTHLSSSSARRMRDYLRQLDDGSVIVAVSADEATNHLGIVETVFQRHYGVRVHDVRYRGSFAFIAQKGYPDKTVLSKVLSESESHRTPAHVKARIRGIILHIAVKLLPSYSALFRYF